MNVSPRSLTVFGALIMCLLGLQADAGAEGRRSKLDKALRDARRQGSVHDVIIRTPPANRVALKHALEAHGDRISAEHLGVSALSVSLHGEDLAALEADPGVLSVSLDAEVSAFLSTNTPLEVSAEGDKDQDGTRRDVLRHSLGLDVVPFDGTGINVAVIDSGIAPIRDLQPQIAGFWDFTRGGVATRPKDDFGHGTHVAGLIASSGLQSRKEFEGIAPGVRLYGFKVLDDKGRGRTSDVVAALEFIVANRRANSPAAFKIDVINLSLGHRILEPAETDPLVRAVENAVRAGIVVVTAAGNIGTGADGTPGYAGITSPGNAPSALTVGASDNAGTPRISDDRVALFSSRGPTWFDGMAKPELVAPGVDLTSDAPRLSSLFKTSLKERSGSYGKLSGTSMAAAVVSGISSLVLQASRSANPDARSLTPNALKAVLQYTAFRLRDADGALYDALTQGTGEINARGSVAMALAIDTDIPAGSHWLGTALEPSTPIGGAQVDGSSALLWDDAIIWGTDALELNAPQWADDIVWGSVLGDDNLVWGTAADVENIVWGTAVVWAADLVSPDRLVGLMTDPDNIVWGTVAGLTEDNIVWGTWHGDDIVWGTWDGENIVWGTSVGDVIAWGTADDVVWGTADDIVWGTADEIVWGTRKK